MEIRLAAMTALIVGLSASVQALALERPTKFFVSAVNSCQGARPSFEGELRKSPRAMVNEGDAIAFVTCGFTMHDTSVSGQIDGTSAGVGDAIFVQVFLHNAGKSSALVSCTLSNDQELDTTGDEAFVVKSTTIAPGARGSIFWAKADNAGALPFRLPGISCALPSRFGIEQTSTSFSVLDN